MQTTTSQTAFLAKSHNKSRLTVMLNSLLNDVDIQTIQAPADADALIVSNALSVAESQNCDCSRNRHGLIGNAGGPISP